MNARLFALGLLTLAACSSSPPSLVIVHIDAEPGVQAMSRSYTVRVEGRAPGGEFTEEYMESYQGGWGRDLTIGPRGHDASRSYRITLTAFEDPNSTGEGFVRNVIVSGYVQSQTRRYDLILYDACQGVECGVNELCDRRGDCQPAEIPATDLMPSDAGSDGPAVPDVVGGLDTGVDAALMDAALMDAALMDAALMDAALMDAALPDVSAPFDGGVDGGLSDAGHTTPDGSLPTDAGTPDVGSLMDAGTSTDSGPATDAAPPMDAGTFMDSGIGDGSAMSFDSGTSACADEGMPCPPSAAQPCATTAVIVCELGEPVCTATAFRPAGEECGPSSGSCPRTCDGVSAACADRPEVCVGPLACCPVSGCAADC